MGTEEEVVYGSGRDLVRYHTMRVLNDAGSDPKRTVVLGVVFVLWSCWFILPAVVSVLMGLIPLVVVNQLFKLRNRQYTDCE